MTSLVSFFSTLFKQARVFTPELAEPRIISSLLSSSTQFEVGERRLPSMFIAHEPQIPSLQDLLKVRVGSNSFLILRIASNTIGPHLFMSIE